MKKLKILHIITNLPVGGAQDNTLITVDGLDKNRYDVSLMSASDGQWLDRARSIKGIKLIFIDELIRKIDLFYDIIALVKIFRVIRKGNYDIVHTHSSKPGFSGRIAARLAGVPHIIHTIHGFPFHDFMNPVVRQFFIYLERYLSKLSDILITVSKLNLNKVIELGIAPPKKLVNIYSGILFEKFSVPIDIERKKRSLGFESGHKIIGMVGRLSAQKAPQYFIESIPAIRAKFPNARFIIVGDGELREEVEELIHSLDLHDILKLLGFRDDVPEILQILDVYVLSSCWEGLGRSLTEAMYLGRPVVATAVEGVPELVVDEETGLLVSPRDPEAIARGVIRLLENPKEALRLGRNAHNKVIGSFSADQMIKEIDHLYQRITSDHNA
ncbi:glycosyltransferase family 4 protein [candidate division KSB1 bacterium]|nr:glycosyltransferase family 4 protein [candidate division KSB1 bacterium]